MDGVFDWNCIGINGGSIVSCMATKISGNYVTGDDISGRKWSDNTFARTCNAYKNPTNPYIYTGNTGDGVYWIDPDGVGGNAEFKAYCDMTMDDGGWTLVARATA